MGGSWEESLTVRPVRNRLNSVSRSLHISWKLHRLDRTRKTVRTRRCVSGGSAWVAQSDDDLS